MMLDPDNRGYYTRSLTPPPGYVLDQAFGTTYSLDLDALLELPVAMAFGELAPDSKEPSVLLASLGRLAKKITVFVQKGGILAPKNIEPNKLRSLIHNSIVEVQPPPRGSFHVKLWILRYVPVGSHHDDPPVRYRVFVPSRNLTKDPSWDTALLLEGAVTDRDQSINKPLIAFMEDLAPNLAAGSSAHLALHFVLSEILKVEWDLPPEWESLRFYFPGHPIFEWKPPPSEQVLVVSPFLSNEAVKLLLPSDLASASLVSRPESLAEINPAHLSQVACYQLHPKAESDDGEDTSENALPLSSSLHAKVYVFEAEGRTTLVLGSANATNAALVAGLNQEILVEIVGKSAHLGTIEKILGSDNLGKILEPWETLVSEDSLDEQKQEAEEQAKEALTLIREAPLWLAAEPADTAGLWHLKLYGDWPKLPGQVKATLTPMNAVPALALPLTPGPKEGLDLGTYSVSLMTRLVVIELTTEHPEVTLRFVLNLPLPDWDQDPMPEIMESLLETPDAFYRYLLFFTQRPNESLKEGLLPHHFLDSRPGSKSHAPMTGILERLLRSLARNPDMLQDLGNLIEGLRSKEKPSGLLTAEFLQVWDTLKTAGGWNG